VVIIIGSIDFASSAVRDAAVAAAAAMQQSTRDTEPGCLAYSFSADSSVPARVQVHEIWADEASLAAHFEHPNFTGMKQLLSQFERAGASSVLKYRVDATGAIYDAQRRPRADFFDT
jgi:quinol monooxygenase YgiN